MVDTAEEPNRGALAAELALGLLEGEERAQGLRLCISNPAFAREVEGWSTRLAPLLDTLPPGLPSSRVWNAVAARIGDKPERPSLNRLRAWRAGALTSGAIAAGLALFIVSRPIEPPARIPMAVSQLTGTGEAQVLAISYDPQKGVLRVGAQKTPGDGKGPELWVIPQDGVPRSLGMMTHEGGAMPVDPAMRPLLAADATLAITMEDPTTAPHAAPSGLPVMTGKISII
ncbi:anti-sigma factor [Novosphingobium kaempferiae]|uniref:anti-sigma factor n=1 Tax=Novosphingobium kaempferiae TaxID=2896849 RepID=UPI001E2B394C|nr:anti-sigma factor [Novosphingobium kaempferiae]